MDLNEIIGENIQNLRKQNNLTQKDLAEKFNYTPKAVSKWERGESIPEINTLKLIADYFGITVDCLLTEKGFLNKKEFRTESTMKEMKLVKSLLIISIIWTIAAIIFVYRLQIPDASRPWISFLWAVPFSAMPAIYFYRKNKNSILNFALYSVVLWGLLIAVYFQLFEFDFNLIFLIGIPAELAIVFFTWILNIRK